MDRGGGSQTDSSSLGSSGGEQILDQRLALWAFAPVHGAVVAFSVAGDLDGKELDPGGYKQQNTIKSL